MRIFTTTSSAVVSILAAGIVGGCAKIKEGRIDSAVERSSTEEKVAKANEAGESNELGLRNGTIGRPTGTGYIILYPGGNLCSGTEIVKDRCILSAEHCEPPENNGVYGQGGWIMKGVSEIPVIRSINASQLDVTGINPLTKRDLKVIWVGDRYIDIVSRAPKGAAAFQPRQLATPSASDEGSTVQVTGYGYDETGKNGTAHFGYMTLQRIDYGTAVYNTVIGTYPGGQSLALVPTTVFGGNGTNLCSGDSGGGVMLGGKVIGVNSESNDAKLCWGLPGSNSSTATGLGWGNLTWVNKQIDEFCRPKITVKVGIVGNGAVVARDATTNDYVFGCDPTKLTQYPDACIKTGYTNDLVLNVQDLTNTFTGWQQGSGGKCPCATMNKVCTIPKTYLDYGSQGRLMEQVHCLATFSSTGPVVLPPQ